MAPFGVVGILSGIFIAVYFLIASISYEKYIALILISASIYLFPVFYYRKEPFFVLKRFFPLVFFIFFPFSSFISFIIFEEQDIFYSLDSLCRAMFFVLVSFIPFFGGLVLNIRENYIEKNSDLKDILASIHLLSEKNIVLFIKIFFIWDLIYKISYMIGGSYFFLGRSESDFNKAFASVGSILSFLGRFDFFVLYFMFICAFCYHRPQFKKYFFSYLIFLLIFYIPTSSKEAILSPLFCFIFLYASLLGKNVGKYFLIMGLFFMFISPFLGNYRVSVASEESDVGYAGIMQSSEDFTGEDYAGSIERLALLPIVSVFVEMAPEKIPFRGFDVFLYDFFIVFIPRLIWPEKPSISKGTVYSKDFGLLSDDNTSTSVGSSLMASFYIYEGWWLAVLGMFLFGFVYNVLEKTLNVGMSWGRIVYFILFKEFIVIERDYLSLTGTIIFLILFVLFVCGIALFQKIFGRHLNENPVSVFK